MFNDYGLDNIAWQRQRDAERAARSHRLAVLAVQARRAEEAAAGRLSLAARVLRQLRQAAGVVARELGLLPEYAARAERLHHEIRTSVR